MKLYHNPSRPLLKVITGAFLFIIFLGTYVFIEPYLLTISHTNIKDPAIPPEFEGVSIAFLSDIHHGPFFDRKRVANVVAKTNSLGADIIILGGDYVHGEPKYIMPAFEELSRLKAPLGVYAVLGNHDHWESAHMTRRAIAKAGIKLIDNRAFWLIRGEDRIRIGGVGDLWEDTQDIRPTIQNASTDDFVVLVSHNPDYVEKLRTGLIDLMLSGHTHGGQVTLFGLWAPIVTSRHGQEFRSGLKDINGIKLLVSKGIGTIAPPVRFFARPEINLIVLSKP
jgi:predicted MPP superfamily phosphohydrolase